MPIRLRLLSLARRAGLCGAAFWMALTLPVCAGAGDLPRAPGAEAPASIDVPDEPGQTRFAPTRRRAPTRFAAELRAAEREHAAALSELRAQLDAAPSAERPALQRRIESLKRTREARVLALQLGEALRQGRAPLAARLEQRLAKLSAAGITMPASPAGGAR